MCVYVCVCVWLSVCLSVCTYSPFGHLEVFLHANTHTHCMCVYVCHTECLCVFVCVNMYRFIYTHCAQDMCNDGQSNICVSMCK